MGSGMGRDSGMDSDMDLGSGMSIDFVMDLSMGIGKNSCSGMGFAIDGDSGKHSGMDMLFQHALAGRVMVFSLKQSEKVLIKAWRWSNDVFPEAPRSVKISSSPKSGGGVT